jgi:CHAT domain-containing protein
MVERRQAARTIAVFSDPVFQPDDPRVRRTSLGGETANGGASDTDLDLVRSAKETGMMNFERLIYTRKEAEAIVALASPEQWFKALDFAASRATVMNSGLDQYRIVHFATHGLVNSQHPELSGIVLSLVDEEGRSQEGFLRAHEIYNLKLNAELVVLSACSTALGKEIKGEGLAGLTRGFMYAGAPRVIASLWNVRDEATAELMKRFYRNMLIGKLSPAAALREAQVSMWREPRWAAPFYWAGFVLQGEWG